MNKDAFWMVLRDGSPETRMRHLTYDSALAEAKRLANLCPGQRFFVLQAVGFALRHEPVSYHRLEADPIPF